MTLDEILARLRANANPDAVAGMARFGIVGKKVYGVSIPALRQIAKEAKRDHPLALTLWADGSRECRILAAYIADPKQLTQAQMEQWARAFDSWEVCDQVCSNLFQHTPWAYDKAASWSTRDEEFVKRAAFALIAGLAVHDKRAADDPFEAFLPLIARAATDERNFVKKAVNWALRQIGKRNARLNKQAIACAERLQSLDSKSARWIAADALRELRSDAVQQRLAGK